MTCETHKSDAYQKYLDLMRRRKENWQVSQTALGFVKLMTKWQPPATARNVIVFADNDGNFAGQHAAYSLAHRLHTEGYRVEVRIPDLEDTDWNDMLGANA